MHRFFLIFLFLLEMPIFGQTVITVSPKTENLTLSDIAKSVEYITLETNEDCIIETVGEFTISDSYILLSSYQSERIYGMVLISKTFYYLFTRTGQFVTQIDVGEISPDEHIYAKIISINEKDKQVLLFFVNINGSLKNRLSY